MARKKHSEQNNSAGKTLLWVGAAAILVVAAVAALGLFGSGNGSAGSSVGADNNPGGVPHTEADITVFKDMGCGCCGLYADYLKRTSGLSVQVVDSPELASIKDEKGIPEDLRSCHTSVAGDYFVEGHVPFEAIQKLMEEKPDIKGIALAGMPSGAPGMPGSKNGKFVIYAVKKDGSVEEFMTI